MSQSIQTDSSETEADEAVRSMYEQFERVANSDLPYAEFAQRALRLVDTEESYE